MMYSDVAMDLQGNHLFRFLMSGRRTSIKQEDHENTESDHHRNNKQSRQELQQLPSDDGLSPALASFNASYGNIIKHQHDSCTQTRRTERHHIDGDLCRFKALITAYHHDQRGYSADNCSDQQLSQYTCKRTVSRF